MLNHLGKPLKELLANNEKIVSPGENFNINGWQKFTGRLRYYFSLSILAFFFLFLMPPIETKDLRTENDLLNLLDKVRGVIAEELGKK